MIKKLEEEIIIGKTLKELSKNSNFNINGICIFELESEEDMNGKMIAEDFSLKYILIKHPELKNKKVVKFNDYFGETIYRVI